MAASESIAKHSLLLSRIVSREIREHSNCTRGSDGFIDPDSCYVPFWYTRTGVIVKWSLFLGLTTILPYASGQQPQQQQPYGNYGMHPVPPPVYDPDAPRPPMYPGPPLAMAMVQPPDGATKVDPMQPAPPPPPPPQPNSREEQYEAPPGPPPSAQAPAPIRQQGTGGTNPFRD
ncbi:hypothetical protein SMACR_05792 [Sordaria macrospora]|uniref:WGS project CABT00000000 data, contig 2.6 n=2 Tax=Sordaria macrospora TaxID=5147 RepID=F7VT92_SORMK|nr:uncharacterized protein SMAC_05792 [Sordaria macrospora k-hell]KAA8629055.1 hypothetical protein SMACR_05792 [Sordaria macrospora]WPJ57841.1 hypothetical protein SMAC4_05792 [Sordaria macrospora]CCC08548.1 unnamed protein product [Sordaria macrospora k-hell]